jgi:hypothetical protein
MPLTSGYVFSDAVQVHRRPLPVRAPPAPHSHGQENAWPRTAGMGAVTLTAHPVPSPAGPAPAARYAPPGIMTRQGPGIMAPTDRRAVCKTRRRARPTPAPADPGCCTGDRRQLPGGTPEPGQATAGSRRDPQPADYRDARRPTAIRAHADERASHRANRRCNCARNKRHH